MIWDGAPSMSWGYGIWLAVMALCTAFIVYTDLSWYWIPDGIVGVVALGNGAAWLGGLVRPDMAVSAGIALLFVLLYIVYPRGIGSGDIKLAAALCLGCSGSAAYIMMTAAFLSAAAGAAVWQMHAGKGCIPFGPYLWIGWWIALAAGERLMAWLF